jgi:hypothetical protein
MVGRAVDTIVTSRAARKTQAQRDVMTVAICARDFFDFGVDDAGSSWETEGGTSLTVSGG